MCWVAPMGNIGERLPPAHHAETAGMGIFPTGDQGHVVLGIFTEDHFWSLLCRHIGLDQFAELAFAERGQRAAELNGWITQRFATHSRDALVAELDPLGVPIAPVLTREEAMRHPHFQARGVIARSDAAAGRKFWPAA